MTQPIQFDAATARHVLPLLVAGQAQKEFFVNEAFARIDTLLHPVVEGEVADPPASPEAGSCWIVGAQASGEWENQDGSIANWDGSQWSFCAPATGMQVFERSSGTRITWNTEWMRPSGPAAPTGGTVIDSEARSAIAAILGTLVTLGAIPAQ